MTIEKWTRIAKRKDPLINGVYDWDSYGSNSMFNQLGGGNNHPTLEQLTAGGYLVETQPVYDPLTHKLLDAYEDDGVYVARKTVAKTQDDFDNELMFKRSMMVVTPWQIRKALNITNGSRAEVEALIATAPQDTQDGWQYASSFERTNDLVLAIGVALGMTDIELDELFALADGL